MKAFDKSNLKTVREDINAALDAVCKKHGIQVSLGNISYNSGSFSVKLTANIPNGTAEAGTQVGEVVKWAANYKTYARAFGMKPEDLGRQVTIGRTTYEIAGMRPKAKLPLVLKKPTGGFIAYDVEPIVAMLSK